MEAVTVSLTDQQRAFLEQEVASGGFGNVSEVVRAALRLYQQKRLEDEAKIHDLRAAIDAGLASGTPRPIEPLHDFLKRMQANHESS
ncbi:MAG: type II toxin-antitoxin system ParD family antitoxin [Chloroflexota bacterium]